MSGIECHCRRCEAEQQSKLTTRELMRWPARFIVCSTCGNKRCPKASDHRLTCTGSNEPGQPGSVYA